MSWTERTIEDFEAIAESGKAPFLVRTDDHLGVFEVTPDPLSSGLTSEDEDERVVAITRTAFVCGLRLEHGA